MPHICINPIPVMTYRLLRTTALALLFACSIAQAAPKAKPAPKAPAAKSASAKPAPAKSGKEKTPTAKSGKEKPGKELTKEKTKAKADPIGKIIKDKQKNSGTKTNENNRKTKKTEPQKRENKKETRPPSHDEIGKIIQRKTPPAVAQNQPSHDAIGSIIQQKQQQAQVATPPVATREEPKSNVEPMGRADADELISNAMGFIGVAYRFGGTSPTGFDCSGFMQYVFRKAFAVNLPRTSAAQASVGSYVSRSELRPGDMVFFRTHGSRISHVGMYIGNDRFIHAPRTGKRIEITSLSSKYWNARYATARRVKRNNAQNYIRN